MASNFCFQCGTKLKQHVRFCPGCGAEILQQAVTEQSAFPTSGFCPECGAPLLIGAVCCSRCGADAAMQSAVQNPAAPMHNPVPQPAAFTGQQTDALTQQASGAGAPAFADFDGILPVSAKSAADKIRNPVSAAFSGIGSVFSGVFKILTLQNIKALAAFLTVLIIWLLPQLLKKTGADENLTQTLSRVTGAGSGLNKSWAAAIGGICGKSMIAAAVSALFCGKTGSVFKGIRLFFSGSNLRAANLGPYFIGAGSALCLYFVFFAGDTLTGAAVAVSCILISLRASGGRNGILYRFVRSLTARKSGTQRQEQRGRITAMLSGSVLGFGASVPAYAYLDSRIVLFIGASMLFFGIVLAIAAGGSKPAAAAVVLLLTGGTLFSLTAPSVSAENSELHKTYHFTYADYPDSLYQNDTLDIEIDGMKITQEEAGKIDGTILDRLTVFGETDDVYRLSVRMKYQPNTISSPVFIIYKDAEDHKIGQASVSIGAHSGDRSKYFSYQSDGSQAPSQPLDSSVFDSASYSDQHDITIRIPRIPEFANADHYEISTEAMLTPGLKLRIYINTSAGVTQTAADNPGEMTAEIPPEIVEGRTDGSGASADSSSSDDGTEGGPSAGVVGALSVAGALGGAGAAAAGAQQGGADEAQDDEERRKKKYRMTVFKNFGSGIRRGAAPLYVYARIGEIVNGAEYNRPDLSEKITVSGNGMQASPAGTENTYFRAAVSVPPDSTDLQATLTFTYHGKEGVFRYNIIFNIVGEPEIIFPSVSADGKNWVLSGPSEPTVLIAGAGGIAKTLFVFRDATAEPEQILFEVENGFSVTYEKSDKFAFAYYAVIENRSAPIEKISGIFAEMRNVPVRITAVFPDKLTVQKSFSFELYPDGITVLFSKGQANDIITNRPNLPAKLQDGRLEVLSYAAQSDMNPRILQTAFDICFAVMTENGTARIVREQACFAFGKLEPTDTATEKILGKYHYSAGMANGTFVIAPEDSIPEKDNKFFVKLPVRASAEGRTEEAVIPVRLLGEPPDPMADWKQEFERLKRVTLRYLPEDIAKDRIRYIEAEYSDPSIFDASQLRMMRSQIRELAYQFWVYDHEQQKYDEKRFALAESVKAGFRTVSDIAFMIVIKYYFPGKDAWIIPVKDLIVDCVDEAIWSYYFTGHADVDVTEKILTQAANYLENIIGVKDSTHFIITQEEQKKLVTVILLYITADWAKNYYKMTPRDFWKSWRQTWFDLTVVSLKKIAGMGLQKVLDSQAAQKFFNSKSMNWVHKILPGKIRGSFTKPGVSGSRGFETSGNADLTLARNDRVWTATHRDSGQNMFVLLGDDTVFLGYRDVIQNTLDTLFGKGIAYLAEALDNAFSSISFSLDIRWMDLVDAPESVTVNVNLSRLFTTADGQKSDFFSLLFEELFGSAASALLRYKPAVSPDPAKEIADLSQ